MRQAVNKDHNEGYHDERRYGVPDHLTDPFVLVVGFVEILHGNPPSRCDGDSTF